MNKLVLTAFFFLIFTAAKVAAYPITISEGETVVLNFDFSLISPPPPYTTMDTAWVMDLVCCSPDVDEGVIEVWSDLNATGRIVASGQWSPPLGYFSRLVRNTAELTDGLFSIAFTSSMGSIDILNARATGINAAGQSVASVDGVDASVPISATLALFGIGLTGLGWSRRFTRCGSLTLASNRWMSPGCCARTDS